MITPLRIQFVPQAPDCHNRLLVMSCMKSYLVSLPSPLLSPNFIMLSIPSSEIDQLHYILYICYSVYAFLCNNSMKRLYKTQTDTPEDTNMLEDTKCQKTQTCQKTLMLEDTRARRNTCHILEDMSTPLLYLIQGERG